MEFLLELLAEELPASHIRSALEQLEEKFESELRSGGVKIEELQTLATPRRLIVVAELAAALEDSDELITGPPRGVGVASDGSFTKAAAGFARSKGVPESSLEIIRTARGEYLGFRRKKKGRPTSEILVEVVPRILSSLSFPKTMRWSDGAVRFSRPLHGLLCLFGGKPLGVTFANLQASDWTLGHRIFQPQKIQVSSFADYQERLRKAKVIVDPEERRAAIITQIEERLAALEASIHPDPDLLEELVFNVEHPFVFLGAFPDSYLNLPLDVLSTAMRAGQKLFSVVKNKKQQPFFLGVADTWKDSKNLIRMGNERVLRARLEDAKFFWDKDRGFALEERAKELRNVVFQEKLGSYEEKCQRLKKNVTYLCGKLDATKTKDHAARAAGLCKADLLTEMVKEFPSLQGKMGGLYAKEEGYPAILSNAIYEHYQPLSLEDGSPASLAGAILSVVDKMDSIVGVIGIGVEVSGSSDPFGLRRNALGVCKTILDKKLHFSFMRLLDKTLSSYGDKLSKEKAKAKKYCVDFFEGRLRFILEKRGFRYDLVSAAVGPGIDEIFYTLKRAQALDSLKSSPLFEPFILMAKRVNNILRDQPVFRVNPDLFEEKEEKDLYSTYKIIRNNSLPMIAKGDFARAQGMIFKIQPILNSFFDKVLVMAEEKRLRKNRLALLQEIRSMIWEMADYSQVVVEGEKPARSDGPA